MTLIAPVGMGVPERAALLAKMDAADVIAIPLLAKGDDFAKTDIDLA